MPESRAVANQALRVLTDKPLKFTVTIHLPNGKEIEFQSKSWPQVTWNDPLRQPWLMSGYSEPIMAWPDGAIMIVQENVTG